MAVTTSLTAPARTGCRIAWVRRIFDWLWRSRPIHERFCFVVAGAAVLLFPVRLLITLILGALL